MKPRQWELWLGKPRSRWWALIPILLILLGLGFAFVAEWLGYEIPTVFNYAFRIILYVCIACIIISSSAYALLAAMLILAPAWLILAFGNQEIEKETWFWSVTAVTTVLGSIAFTRYSRIWKIYRG